MHNEIDSYKSCKDLQNLLNITLNDVIKPLRHALTVNPSSKIIALEIRDAENKAFEYIAAQITAIGNANENESSRCLLEFPKSDVCYRCIGLDEDTIEGLIRIRNLSFLNFLELDLIVCQKLLQKYMLNDESIEKILKACQTIKKNVDILYSNSDLNDDTRNLIKLVTRLVDNKFTIDDIDVIGIPDWNKTFENHSDDSTDKSTPSCSPKDYDITPSYDNRIISDYHPSNIISTKRPFNKETLVKAIQTNAINDERNLLNAKYNNHINSLSVPNTPNVQKCRFVGSEEILAEITPTNEKPPNWSNTNSPMMSRKNMSQADKSKTFIKTYNSLQRSLSHEFEYKNHLTDKGAIAKNGGTMVFQFHNDKYALDQMERRSSYEEKSLNKTTGDFITDNINGTKLIKNLDTGGSKINTHHKFESDSKFGIQNIVKSHICSVCKLKKFLPKMLYCDNCKIRVHKTCLSLASEIPCSVSPMPERKHSQNSDANPNNNHQGSESNSASSCNSSPASPFNLESGYNSSGNVNSLSHPHHSHISPRHPSPMIPSSSGGPGIPNSNNKRFAHQKFEFSVIDETDTTKTNSEEADEPSKLDNVNALSHLNRSVQRLESTESQDEFSRLSRTNSISVALKEWEIPLENLQQMELLGRGSFSTVYKGKWHGEVAIKIMNLAVVEDGASSGSEECMSAFKSEVGALHKTRHENLVLFMGACMKPPNLAIVTQLSQGETLYHQLHWKHATFPVVRAINIASQVAKGMGYLHAKHILHKDLKSRNIFIENNCKAVISDFGLFDFVRMCKQARSGSYLRIPRGWLCYLSPEIIRHLNFNFVFSAPLTDDNNSSGLTAPPEDLPFSKQSDVFAFGTIWYEILNSKWPFEGLPSEAIIFKVGKGIKETLRSSHSKEFKDLLLSCWATEADSRPHFTSVVQLLEKLPKLQRSPSYPVKSVTVGRNHDNLIA